MQETYAQCARCDRLVIQVSANIITEFRGASEVDPMPWKYWEQNVIGNRSGNNAYESPDAINFPLIERA